MTATYTIPAHVSRRIAEEVSAELDADITPEQVDECLTTGKTEDVFTGLPDLNRFGCGVMVWAKARDYGLLERPAVTA